MTSYAGRLQQRHDRLFIGLQAVISVTTDQSMIIIRPPVAFQNMQRVGTHSINNWFRWSETCRDFPFCDLSFISALNPTSSSNILSSIHHILSHNSVIRYNKYTGIPWRHTTWRHVIPSSWLVAKLSANMLRHWCNIVTWWLSYAPRWQLTSIPFGILWLIISDLCIYRFHYDVTIGIPRSAFSGIAVRWVSISLQRA